MGEVYAAEARDGQKVAIKVLHDAAAEDPDLVTRFQREAQIASQIRSAYVAAILGTGQEESGAFWIAFELLEGEGLDARLDREQYLSFAEVAPLVSDGLQGLIAAHAAGVIHRDIKPANLFVERRALSSEELSRGEPEERVRILDFGVSKIRNGERSNEPSLTGFDTTLGSFAYMAPEQVRESARVDPRADIYALGAVAFRALTGRLPFQASNTLALLALKLERDPPTLGETTGDEWPGGIERFMAKILSTDREGRFATAREALDAWNKVCAGMGNMSRRSPPSRRVPVSAEQTVTSHTEPAPPLPPWRDPEIG